MTITYRSGNGLGINLTNRCPCSCVFCVRSSGSGIFSSDSLWLDREPSVREICGSIDEWELEQFDEVKFCGYGEPTERLEALLRVAGYIKSKSRIRISLSTSGLSDLINGERTAPRFKGLIDRVSVGLYAPEKERYLNTVNPKFGEISFQAMLDFTKECVEFVPEVFMNVYDLTLSEPDQLRCREIAESVGARLNIVPFED